MKADEVINMFKSAKGKFRHGDVILVKADDQNIEAEGDNKGIVAEGEATGHAHRILDKASVQKVKGQMDQMLIRALDETKIEHEEHDDGALAKGNYISGIQRQYRPEGWSRVAD